jgi:hypothetical protein
VRPGKILGNKEVDEDLAPGFESLFKIGDGDSEREGG